MPPETGLREADKTETSATSKDSGQNVRQLAEQHTIVSSNHDYTLLEYLETLSAFLEQVHSTFSRQAQDEGLLTSHSAEWLLDNYYIVQQAIRQIGKDLTRSFFGELPKLAYGSCAGLPRVYAIAKAYIKQQNAQVSSETFHLFISSYQDAQPLTTGEIWALPIMLRIGILESLASAVAAVLDEQSPSAQPPLTVSPDLPAHILVGNCILSLRAIATEDWKDFYEDVSLLEQTLMRDPADVYRQMDFETRNHYRKVVEKLSKSTTFTELEIARLAVQLARAVPLSGKERGLSERQRHVGYYLIDAGRYELERELKYQPGAAVRLHRWLTKRHSTFAFLGAITLLTLAFATILLVYAAIAGASIAAIVMTGGLILIPALTLATNLVAAIAAALVRPRVLPKMDFEDCVPDSSRTMVVVPALISKEQDVDSLLSELELHHLRNPGPHITYALLTDFADAEEKTTPGDEALVQHAKEGAAALNERYPGSPFYFFHRERLWNEQEDAWMGWERKRGKLEEFNRLLRGHSDTSFNVQLGDLSILPEVCYVITLDADTILPQGAASRLIGTMAHPLNRPYSDPATGRVIAGYTVLQPRVEIESVSGNRTRFSRIYSGASGFDLYTHAVSDVYQDLFGEGIYVGKGIYDVDAFSHSLKDRVPENVLLSHDLFEGIHGRAGLVTDITLYEEYPPGYLTYAHRRHRWIRGDWQLLPWLRPRVFHKEKGTIPNTLSAIDLWKVIDNLRRSLLPMALLAMLIAGWLWLPGAPAVWTLAAITAPAGAILSGLTALAIQLLTQEENGNGFLAAIKQQISRWLLFLTSLPYEALIANDAIMTVLVRLFITHKQLLQWTTAAKTVNLVGGKGEAGMVWRQMVSSSVVALVLTTLIAWLNPAALLVSLPLLLAWFLSPAIAAWLSKPIERRSEVLQPQQVQQLRRLARSTWLYFEKFMGPEDHWLPPDHFQEHPRGLAAHRTSPTNIGLALLSTLGAHDLGYVSLQELAIRLQYTFRSLDALERYRGHFLNWYDTHTMKPLPARYVSTVDSGNLAACLIALQQGCQLIPDIMLPRRQRWQGFLDTVAMLSDALRESTGPEAQEIIDSLHNQFETLQERIQHVSDKPEQWTNLLGYLSDEAWPIVEQNLVELVETRSLSADQLRRIRIWTEVVQHSLFDMKRRHSTLTPWLVALEALPTLLAKEDDLASNGHIDLPEWDALLAELPPSIRVGDIAGTCRKASLKLVDLRRAVGKLDGPPQEIAEAQTWCDNLTKQLAEAAVAVSETLAIYASLGEQCADLVQDMTFDFLYDSKRHLFRIGYNVDAEQPDPNYYDLLASEARTTSLIAIAKGEVPQQHWLMLGRPLRNLEGIRTLISWSGSMFEYLMPILWTRQYENSLLQQSIYSAVRTQIEYGKSRHVPWGVSECGYNRFDAAMNYQYRAFGVPQLGLKRGLEDDLVVTPYASLLALPIQQQAVMENLQRLNGLEMWGDYGFYESVDYTRSRLSLGREQAQVRSFMVHHQGMIFLSLVNALVDEVMVRRFHSHPRIKSVELLLQERIPTQTIASEQETASDSVPYVRQRVTLSAWPVPTDTLAPQVHYLSNGRYGVLITNAGGGFSRWKATDLTRWHADSTCDDWGTWIYVQDLDHGKIWSVGPQPITEEKSGCEVTFAPHKVDFKHLDQQTTTHTEITVPPDDDVEIRRVQITNHSNERRMMRLVSYAEVILTQQEKDRQHPAFNKLFINSEYLSQQQALLFTRRPRSSEEEPPVMAHQIVVEPGWDWIGSYETDRRNFIGRDGSVSKPAALCGSPPRLSNVAGATLDPIMSQSIEIQLPPHSTVGVAFLTMAGKNLSVILDMTLKYSAWGAIDSAFDRAYSQSESELRQLDLDASRLQQFQRMLSQLLYPTDSLRAAADILAANTKGQPGLWTYAISGDYPILLTRLRSEEDLGLVRELIKAHIFWRNRGLKIGLVLMNERPGDYNQNLQGQLRRLLQRMESDHWEDRRGGIFLLQKDMMSTADQILLETAARVIIDAHHGSLPAFLQDAEQQLAPLPEFVTAPDRYPRPDLAPPARPTDLCFDNGWGGFSTDGREYVIYRKPGRSTPAPWINVIANPMFGCLVSETGSGFTWAVNSGENRLTPWNNDPVSNPPAETLYLRDEETAEVWTATPSPAGADTPYLIRHGAGYSSFENHSHGLRQRQRIFVAPDAPVKIIQLHLENRWNHTRRITATYYAEWVLGVQRDVTQQYIVPEYDAGSGVLLARNSYNVEFGERVAFLAASQEPHSLTADRTDFLGRLGNIGRPAALERVGMVGRVQPGLDPCAALQIYIELEPGETQEIHFVLGQGADRDESFQLAKRFRDKLVVLEAWHESTRQWTDFLDTLTIETPDQEMNILLNCWLPYQNLSCRIWGRSALYQSSGAYGFRDQLQDVMAVLYQAPDVAREHILRAARHQFEIGDVLHWWHPPSGRGVRTRISDDLLWLPYVTAYYVSVTGDYAILDEQLPFLTGEPLWSDEEERYGHYSVTEDTYSLYEHCCRAIESGMSAGRHGLPLIGAGDWNDGFNRVGIEGRGESVWLGWFLYATLDEFLPISERMNDARRARDYRQNMDALRHALEENAWDGDWYIRAYYDDGAKLGSSQNTECQIDSIAQSWAVLSRAGDPDRIVRAFAALDRRLIQDQERLILLFTPPFDETARDPGYIKGYPPGIRENGGQYTHAAIWTVWAYTVLGNGDRAGELYRMLNAITHSDTREKAALYRVEPYVTAADVYGAAPFSGRGGWTWYTGSGGWLYRLGVEAILGLRRRGQILSFDPCIPRYWTGYRLVYRFGTTTYEIEVTNPDRTCRGVAAVSMDDTLLPSAQVFLTDDGAQHKIIVRLGKAPEREQDV